MDLSGLGSVTNASQMNDWLTSTMVTPVTPAISASDMATILQKMIAILGTGQSPLVLFNVSDTDYTLALTDTAVAMNVADDNTLTIPQNEDVAFPIGAQILLMQSGAGQTTVQGEIAVAINSADGYVSLRTQYSWANLIQTDTDVWWLYGDLAESTPEPPSPPPLPAQTINVYLTNGEQSLAGWNPFQLDSGTTPMSLTNSDSVASGATLVTTTDSVNAVAIRDNGGSFGNMDFPDSVLDTGWYLFDDTSVVTLNLSGFGANQQCTITVCSADTATSNNDTKIIVGYPPDNIQSYLAQPQNVAVEYPFTVTADDNGNLSIQYQGAEGSTAAVLNAFIISIS